MTTMPLMRCGHRAQGHRASDQAPVCVICAPAPGYDQPQTTEEAAKVTEGRMMRCAYRHGQDGHVCAGRTPRPSNPQAAFFASKPDEPYDEFYDGCWGWD